MISVPCDAGALGTSLADSWGMATMNRAMVVLGFTLALASGRDAEDGSASVGREGGVVTSADGRVTLEIPAGALTRDVEVTIGEVDDAGPEGAIGFAYELEPAGLVLARPATVTFDLTAGDAEARELDLSDAGLAVEDLAIVSAKAGTWDRLSDRETDAELAMVSGSVLYLGTVAVAPR